MSKKVTIGVVPFVLLMAFVAILASVASQRLGGVAVIEEASAQSQQKARADLDSLDAVIAAPDNHKVLLENDRVRVLEVTVPPHTKEHIHTHKWESVMYIDGNSRNRYYNAAGQMIRETGSLNRNEMKPMTLWIPPEEPHSVENISDITFHAIRIELKK